MPNAQEVLEWIQWDKVRKANMTNEQWFCQLSTKEKAKFLAAQQLHGGTIASRSDVDWEVWLEEKHNEIR